MTATALPGQGASFMPARAATFWGTKVGKSAPQELRSEGLIALANGTLNILNWQSLREEGDFQAEYLHITRKAA
jgi:hypothetical protein